MLISGGIGDKGCNTQVYTLDTENLPSPGSPLPTLPGHPHCFIDPESISPGAGGLSSEGQVAVATDGGDSGALPDYIYAITPSFTPCNDWYVS